MKINDDEKMELVLALNDRLDKFHGVKGVDVIVKTARINKLLKQLEFLNENFSW